ncbi:hypothetical protein [Gordonia humi]|uniref:Uncharacterized protein n=1 Tax=Gordonia humi TaxID=686429 RepID=A0A840EUR3_9ACTN|nr:hypothetical protein [Gordonia humi]MBB4136655.1 hypothetical protein [Gordonia humi]
MTHRTNPTLLVIGAAVVSIIGFVVAGTVDHSLVRVVGALFGLAAAGAGAGLAARSSRTAGLVAVAAVPLAVVVVGAPVAGILDAADSPPTATRHYDPPVRQTPAPKTLDEQLAAAIEHADVLAPGGSASILSIRFGWASELVVLDPRDQSAVSASWDEDGWGSPSHDVARTRDTFAAVDLSSFSFRAVEPLIASAAKAIGDSGVGYVGTVVIERRDPDHRLLASFDSDDPGRKLQVDARGRLPDTLDMASMDTVLAGAGRAMRAVGLDPRTTPMSEFDFRTTRDGANFPGASQIMNSGGVIMAFDDGPIDEILVRPGEFPIAGTGPTYSSGRSFTLTDLTRAGLTRAREDQIRRHSLSDADRDLVGFQAGGPFGEPRQMRMSVGPMDVEGRYTFGGRYVG